MRQVFSVLVCLVAGSALATDASRRSLGKISASAVPEQHAKKVHLEAVIDASPDRAWGIVTDRAKFKRTMPRTVASTELSRDGDVVVCQSTLELTWPLPDLIATTRAVHTTGAGHWRSEWTLVSGDYNVNQGSWDLTPFAACRCFGCRAKITILMR